MARGTRRLRHVLGQIKHDAGYAIVAGAPAETVRLGTLLYNQVLARLGELVPEVGARFRPLHEAASPAALRMSARSLLCYLDEPEHLNHRCASGNTPRMRRTI